jgi:RecA-family ATPase
VKDDRQQELEKKFPVGYSRPLREVYKQAIEELHQPFPSMRLKSWGKFDLITGGLRVREFTIICGPTGKGKTTFLANLTKQLLQEKIKVYVASVETGDTDFAKRIMSVFAQEDLNTGDAVSLDKLAEFNRRHGEVFVGDGLHLALFDDRVPVEILERELRYHCAEKGCKVAMLDNLNFFMDTVDERDWLREMDRVIHKLVILAKQIDMHIIMVMHPKKTDGGRVESEFDIKGSSTAVQEAHNVLLFNPPAEHICKADAEIHPRTHREIKFAKLRRRGKFAGARLVFKNESGAYIEKGMYFDN